MNSIRWSLMVSPDTDQAVRMFIAARGDGYKVGLSRFVEEAVRAHILELSVKQAKAANVGVNESNLAAIVAEAIQWARKR